MRIGISVTIRPDMRIGNESGAGLTRRELFQTAPAVIAGAVLSPSPAGAADSPVRRMTTGWEHYRGQLGGVWEVWRGKAASDNVTWDAVAIPHCFNAWDAVDPDHAYGVADDQGLGQNVEQLLLHFAGRLKYPGIELKLIARG